jgi:hypothetical protein
MKMNEDTATMIKPTPYYVAHLVHKGGRKIDTPTGTRTFAHGYYRAVGGRPLPALLSDRKIYTKAQVARRFNKSENWRGYYVTRVEVKWFDAGI